MENTYDLMTAFIEDYEYTPEDFNTDGTYSINGSRLIISGSVILCKGTVWEGSDSVTVEVELIEYITWMYNKLNKTKLPQ